MTDLVEARVTKIPSCDICPQIPELASTTPHPAAYDGKTCMGPWANMCEWAFYQYGVGLGTGRGQRLVLRSAE